MTNTMTLCTVTGLLGWLMLGCGGNAQPASDLGDGAVFSVCANETRADAYAAGMVKPSKDGLLTVELVSSEPGPPIKGTNIWTITIKTAAGAPFEGATIGVSPYMPDHNHGATVKAVATPLPTGGYSIKPLHLYMAGLWQTTLQIQSADKMISDSVMFSFCVQG